jgi:uncharacterized OsmC-like protein
MTAMLEKTPLTSMNGVDVTRLGETVDAIKTNPAVADFKFRVANQWHDGARSTATITDFDGAGQRIDHKHPLEIACDEPDILLGKDDGANPVEVLLAALSGCMTTSLAYHAAANGLPLQDIQSSHEGDIDLQGFLGLAEVPKGYQEIRINFRVKGDASKEKVEEFLNRSPVLDTLRRPIQIKINVEKI